MWRRNAVDSSGVDWPQRSFAHAKICRKIQETYISMSHKLKAKNRCENLFRASVWLKLRPAPLHWALESAECPLRFRNLWVINHFYFELMSTKLKRPLSSKKCHRWLIRFWIALLAKTLDRERFVYSSTFRSTCKWLNLEFNSNSDCAQAIQLSGWPLFGRQYRTYDSVNGSKYNTVSAIGFIH